MLARLDREFTHTFGGCTIHRGIDGRYLARAGERIEDRINLIYADIAITLSTNRDLLVQYASELKQAAHEALEEEAVLIVVMQVYHAG